MIDFLHMKKIVFLVLMSILATGIFAQDSGISFEVDYPLIFSDKHNQYSDTSGVLGGALQYQITDNIPFNFGLEYKFDLIQATEITGSNGNVKTSKRAFLINNLNVYSKMLFIDIPELQLYVTGGFSTYKYRGGKGIPSYIGYNAGGGLTYDILDRTYLLVSYSFIKARLKQYNGNTLNVDKNQLIRLGFGFKF